MVRQSSLHDAIGLRLAEFDQRYTPLRRVLVETLSASGRPLTIPEILQAAPALPQSSVYRNLTALIDAGALHRVTGTDDRARFELSESFSGHHHHHLVCASCGTVEDFSPSTRLERALGDTIRAVGERHGYQVAEHLVELRGLCSACART